METMFLQKPQHLKVLLSEPITTSKTHRSLRTSQRKEELMGRFFKSFLNDPSEPVADDTVLKVSSMLSHDNKHQYKVPNPNADDYLESLQKRWWC